MKPKRSPKQKQQRHGMPRAAGPKTDWSPVARWYDQLVGEEGSEYHREVVLPGVIRLLGVNSAQRVLDVACGQGVLARLLAGKGVHVVGIDAAKGLIAAAKQRNESIGTDLPAPAYFVADARDLSFLEKQQNFDAAACVLAIQNMHPLAEVFQSVSRLVKPLGRFVMVMMHPCFRGPKETQWGWDEQKQVQYRRVDRYLIPRKTPIVAHPGAAPDVYTWTFHKPLQDYVKSLRQSGMMVDAIEEWPSHKTSTSGPRAAAENMARKEIPMFMAIRGVKVGAPEDVKSPEG